LLIRGTEYKTELLERYTTEMHKLVKAKVAVRNGVQIALPLRPRSHDSITEQRIAQTAVEVEQ